MTVSIWPSTAGETPLQNYNSCLSLAHIQNNADASLCFQNDTILKAINKMQLLKSGKELKDDVQNMTAKGYHNISGSDSGYNITN